MAEKQQTGKATSEAVQLRKEVEQQGKIGTEAKALKAEIDGLRSTVLEKDRKTTELTETIRRLEE